MDLDDLEDASSSDEGVKITIGKNQVVPILQERIESLLTTSGRPPTIGDERQERIRVKRKEPPGLAIKVAHMFEDILSSVNTMHSLLKKFSTYTCSCFE
jgi:hypothetical protein